MSVIIVSLAETAFWVQSSSSGSTLQHGSGKVTRFLLLLPPPLPPSRLVPVALSATGML